LRVDEAVGAEIVRLLQPLGVEAAVHAITECEHQSGEKQRQFELALEQARYEAARARRQYDSVDPDNRLVAGELERRWNTALAAVRALEEELEALLRQRPAALSAKERQRLLQMGADLEAAWHHPAANAVTRKRIIRVVLREVVARVEDDQIQLLLHWQGGDHTRLTVRKNRRGQTRWSVEPETMELIRACARLMPDKAIAEEKREPVSDIDTAVVDSLKALDPERPIREARTWGGSRARARRAKSAALGASFL
jgi:hypothetical protein